MHQLSKNSLPWWNHHAHCWSYQFCTECRGFQPGLKMCHSTCQGHNLDIHFAKMHRGCCSTCLEDNHCMQQVTQQPRLSSICPVCNSGKRPRSHYLEKYYTFQQGSSCSLHHYLFQYESSRCPEDSRNMQTCSELPLCLTTALPSTWHNNWHLAFRHLCHNHSPHTHHHETCLCYGCMFHSRRLGSLLCPAWNSISQQST